MAKKFEPFDSLIFHRVQIEGQKDRISDTVLKQLKKLSVELKKAIKNRNNDNILELQSKISAIVEEYYNKLQSEFVSELSELLEYESDYQKTWLDKTIEETPEDSLLPEAAAVAGLLLLTGSQRLRNDEISSIINNKAVRGATIQEQINSQKAQLKEMVRRGIITSINDGLNDDEIIAEVGKAFNRNRAGTEAMLKTVVNAHTNDVALETFRKNGFKFYKYVAVLDSRTTETCKGLNGKVFKIGEGPLPPQHYGCRSFIIPVIIKNGEVTEFKEFSKNRGDERIEVDDNGNFKKNDKFNYSLSKMKREDNIW